MWLDMRKWLTFLLLFTTVVIAEERTLPQTSQVIAVVVPANQDADALQLTPNKIKQIFLRKQLYWPNSKRVLPVNLSTEHPLRNQFSKAVLGSLPSEQINYWNGLYFNGVRPPHVVNSEEAVIRYLGQTPGAVGYIDACKADVRVAVAFWVDAHGVLAEAPDSLDCN
jgi:hypothetical protein